MDADEDAKYCLAAREAHACGVPVVGTAVGGLPTFVTEGESGFLVERNEEAFAGRLHEVLRSPRRRLQMRSAAVESARRFSWVTTANANRSVYDV